jgi:hypothetical protein
MSLITKVTTVITLALLLLSSTALQLTGPAEAKLPDETVTVFLYVDGTGRQHSTREGNTVHDLLTNQGVELGEHDEVSQDPDTALIDNSLVTIVRVRKEVKVKVDPIPFETVKQEGQVECAPSEEEKLVKEGVPGEKVSIHLVTTGDFIPLDVSPPAVALKEAVPAVIAPCAPPVTTTTAPPTPESAPTPVLTGSKEDWMRAAGIPEADWGNVDYIVTRESGWNPNAVNKSSGACGLAQSLPCGKSEVYGAWNDPVAQLRWQMDYVNQRYGGYAGAVAHSKAKGWY